MDIAIFGPLNLWYSFKICTIKFATAKDAYYANLKLLPKVNAHTNNNSNDYCRSKLCSVRYENRIEMENAHNELI